MKFSIILLTFFLSFCFAQNACTPKYSLKELQSDRVNIFSFKNVKSNQVSSDYSYLFNISTFSRPPSVIYSIQSFSIESFVSINYRLSATVINNKLNFVFRSVDMKWKYFEIGFILSSRQDLFVHMQNIDNFQKTGNAVMEIDVSKLAHYRVEKKYVFVHFVVGVISTYSKSYKFQVKPFDIAVERFRVQAFSLNKASITVQTVYFQATSTQFSYSFNQYSLISSQKNQYVSLWPEFSPLRYYIIGFNMLNFDKQMASLTSLFDPFNNVIELSNWKGLKESTLVYLALGDKSASICSPCNNFVTIAGCLDKCLPNQYSYQLLDGGKTCRYCSPNQGQSLNKQQNGCLCSNNQTFYQGNCYNSKFKPILCKNNEILINNNCQSKIVNLQVAKCDEQTSYLNKEQNLCMCKPGYQKFQGNCITYCPQKSYRSKNGICVCNAGFLLNGLNQCQSICPQYSRYILQLGQCICLENYQLKQQKCQKCLPNQAYNKLERKCVETIAFNAVNIINCQSNEVVKDGLCVCDSKSIKLNDKCVRCQGNSIKANEKCVPCPQNCVSCSSGTECNECKSGFYLDYRYSCEQICGDGRRFTLPCDDGNNINGDGCSAICQFQEGFSCKGGSPTSSDSCELIDNNKKKLSISLAKNSPVYLSPGIMTTFIINPPIKRTKTDLQQLFSITIDKKFKPNNIFISQDEKDLSTIRVFFEYQSSIPNGIFSSKFKIAHNNQEDSLNIMYNTITNSLTSAISYINRQASILT